ncbi:PEPxxWA-CTERM sorting domain-containing protein [Sphingomonas changnyeongensis]|uniref:PEPxxWA-CTERM sorting domain-containing protein n=1 Tax=Sphingomonas changnyeongensis TaxID=2698679 RepID=A0A7Z2S460_9SPHN|nr:PEPxxWA-CTERM sorting domain-containing protein [Sphingomonas changnyeongensis]QHL89715.1 PEPxxWA-CTERM sorting domain-containing protein [Sphingomonas changnyeongensis]
MKTSLFVAAALATVCASAASAGTIVFTGNTSGGPLWNRPIQGNPPTPPASGVGTAVAYRFHQFAVDANGAYSFQSTAVGGWDNYAFLYSNSFNPLTPFANVIVGNDDNPLIGLAGFTTNLTAGTTYFLVITGYENIDAGAYSAEIRGPGNIAAVPEPESWALMIGGFALAGGALRVRRSRIAYA